MKKLIALLMVFVGITSGAMAEQKVYKSDDGFVCARVNEIIYSTDEHTKLQGDPYVYARIYFDTGKAVAHDGCNYDELINALIDKKNDVEYSVFIGMADEQGASKGFNNTDLGYDRAKYVGDWFDGIEGMFYTAGDSNAEAFSRTIDNQEYRSVDIYVIWKQVECEQSDIERTTSMQKSLDECKKCDDDISEQVKGIVNKMAEVCTDAGKKLTASPAAEYKRLWQQLAQLRKDFDKKHPGVLDMRDFAEADYDYLKSLSLKQTVWRDEEGKFNVKRLASDSIAGVVLGTAGGLITSKLVKKNQIKTGFEDIQCTIGGQKVADWHDEFTVGIQ